MLARIGILLCAVVATYACSGDTQRSTETSEDDTVQEIAAPEWTSDSAWRVSAHPSLTIGVDAGPEMQMFSRIRGVLSLDNGGFVVSNGHTGELRFYDETGHFLHRAGGLGQGPGEFGQLSSMRLWSGPGGELIVDDAGANGRVNLFDSDGDFIETVRLERVPDFPRVFLHGVFHDGSWLAMGARGGGRLSENAEPGSIIRSDFAYFLYDGGQGVQALLYLSGRQRYVHRWGTITHFPYIPFTAEPLLLAGRHLYVLPEQQPMIQVLDKTGTVIRTIRWQPDHVRRAEDVWQEYRDESLASIVDEDYRARYAHFFAQDLPLPELVPAYSRILEDANGNLWLERYRVGGNETGHYDVIDQHGRWLGTVAAPPRFTPYEITGEALIGVHRDDMDLETIHVYKVTKNK